MFLPLLFHFFCTDTDHLLPIALPQTPQLKLYVPWHHCYSQKSAAMIFLIFFGKGPLPSAVEEAVSVWLTPLAAYSSI
jgi:hypothetical protein